MTTYPPPKRSKSGRIDLPRLCDAIAYSRRMLEGFRTERKDAVLEYAGPHWGRKAGGDRVPLNLLSLYTQVVSRNLIAKNPRFMLSTFNRGAKPAVNAMQTWANREVEKMNLADTLQRAVLDGLFCLGIAKVGLANPAQAAATGWGLRAGGAFAARVDLEDFVFDTHARDFSEASFIGHRFRVPLDAVRDDSRYHKSRKDLVASTDNPNEAGGDSKLSSVMRDQQGDSDEYQDMVDLWEIYLPRDRLVLTLSDDMYGGANWERGEWGDRGNGRYGHDEPLHATRWLGPDCGPYHLLSFMMVPGAAMPKGPIMDLLDLHFATNVAWRKSIRQMERQKEIIAVQGGALEDGTRIMNADDGDIVRVDNPDRARPVATGGTNQGVLAMALQLKETFDFAAGNMSMMGGLGAQSKTAAQDKMLNENSSRAIADMQDRTVRFTSSVGNALCWYWWHDPYKVMKTEYHPDGLPEYGIERKLTPAFAVKEDGRPEPLRRDAPWEEIDLKVDPYSIQHSTPGQRAAALKGIVMEVCLPMMPLLKENGINLDLHAFLRKIGEYTDQPDLTDIVNIQDPPQQKPGTGGGGEAEQPGMPASTTRNYVRESMPGRTEKGNTMNVVNTLLGANGGKGEAQAGAA